MEYHKSELKAGLFIAISLLLFFAFLFAIKGVSGWERKEFYRARFAYVGGIEPGSTVRLAGVPVGKVSGHRVLPGEEPPVELTLELDHGTPIRRDSYAYITSIGLLGAFYVEIAPGTGGAPLLTSGALIPSREVSSFAQMSGPIGGATTEATELLRRLNDLLNDGNRANLAALITNLNAMTAQNSSELRTLLGNLNELTAALNTTVQNVNGLLAANDTTLQHTMANAEQLVGEVGRLTTQVNATLGDLDHLVVQNRDSYRETMENMRTLSRNLTEFTQTIKEQPWNLVRKNYPAERQLPKE
ncbi:MAG TPA: MlaD family protein [bacterium]|nr:MlaD family protein [bacterium]HPR86961.1 MlaD family protein [bacterium]